MEEGWREVFFLSAAQFQMPLDAEVVSLLANSAGGGNDSSSSSSSPPPPPQPDKLAKLMAEAKLLQEILFKFKQAQVDSTEYACLKAITLFKTGKLLFLLLVHVRDPYFWLITRPSQ